MKPWVSWVLTSALAMVACEVDSVQPIIGCESLSECPLGSICDPDKSKCVPEPDAHFVGAFRCVVREKGDPLEALPGSEVLGNLGDDRWTLPVGGNCELQDNGALVVTFGQIAGDEALTLGIGAKSVEDGGKVDLEDMRQAGVDWALFAHLEGDFAIAYSSGGFVEFYDDIEAGELIEAYLDVRVVPASDAETALSARCPRGDVDCGYSTDSRAPICLENEMESETLTVCSLFCESDAECSFAGGGCFFGVCALPCATDDDCPGSYCYASSEGAFCF